VAGSSTWTRPPARARRADPGARRRERGSSPPADRCRGGRERWNKVLVFNLSFDRKGARGVHWMYLPDRTLSFYRASTTNILDEARMSLYVEIGAKDDQEIDVDMVRERVLFDLAR
jgi:hypothetical protein